MTMIAWSATVVMTVAQGLKMPTLDATVGCVKGSYYTSNPAYGVASSQWGHLPRGGWRGAVLGPDGDKIYGIPTNATEVRIGPRHSRWRALIDHATGGL